MQGQETSALDSPGRLEFILNRIEKKQALRAYYNKVYESYKSCLSRCPDDGISLEIGSGGGYAKKLIPELVTSDVIEYSNVDRIIDATKIDLPDASCRCILMLNVFHHIPDVESFLSEANRCLKKGGRILISDGHLGLLSRIILKYFHHEPFEPKIKEWKFRSSGPLSDANTALAWIVFQRDLDKFNTIFSNKLELVRYTPHTPLLYWLAGGLKQWSLLPGNSYILANLIDNLLLKISKNFGSFVDIELVKT